VSSVPDAVVCHEVCPRPFPRHHVAAEKQLLLRLLLLGVLHTTQPHATSMVAAVVPSATAATEAPQADWEQEDNGSLTWPPCQKLVPLKAEADPPGELPQALEGNRPAPEHQLGIAHC
jgi:hypothetical protein